MPPAIVAAVITAAVSATEIGLQASGAFQPSTSGQEKLLEEQNAAQAKQLRDQKMQAFRHFAPDAQAQSGGNLSANPFAALVESVSGQSGDLNLVKQTLGMEGDQGLAGGAGSEGMEQGLQH